MLAAKKYTEQSFASSADTGIISATQLTVRASIHSVLLFQPRGSLTATDQIRYFLGLSRARMQLATNPTEALAVLIGEDRPNFVQLIECDGRNIWTSPAIIPVSADTEVQTTGNIEVYVDKRDEFQMSVLRNSLKDRELLRWFGVSVTNID